MRKLLIVLMLLSFSVTGIGCYGSGNCPHGVCSEEYSKKNAGEKMAEAEEEKTEEKTEEKAVE